MLPTRLSSVPRLASKFSGTVYLGCCRNFSAPLPNRGQPLPAFPHILKENQIPEADRKKIEQEVEEMTKNWMSKGMHETDPGEDNFLYHLTAFSIFTFFFFTVGVFLWYFPDKNHVEWAHREAYLEIERRRNAGLPLVDPNLIPPDQVKLPTEEELGPGFKIII